jgi:hypothetical protein
MWSTQRLNDMDPCPWSATPPAPTRRDTRTLVTPALSSPVVEPSWSEARRRLLYLVGSLGISLLCQVIPLTCGWPAPRHTAVDRY